MILMVAVTVLPFVFMCMTSFLRFVIVFSILKTALGTQQVPPGMVIIGLAMILTFYSMSPVFAEMYQKGELQKMLAELAKSNNLYPDPESIEFNEYGENTADADYCIYKYE